jgi:AcrR family transcriptional regulator
VARVHTKKGDLAGDERATLPPSKRAKKRSTIGGMAKGVAPTSKLTSRVNRRQVLIDEAARLFGRIGFSATSTRDIANAVGMKPGSLYYHFPSKEHLAVAVHEHRVKEVTAKVHNALLQAGPDPWDRFEAACVAHVELLLDGTGYPHVVSPQFAAALPSRIRSVIIRQRDEYEENFRLLIEELPLPGRVDRRYFRLAIFGSINWTLTWYHPGGDSPTQIAKKLVAVYRTGVDPRTPSP